MACLLDVFALGDVQSSAIPSMVNSLGAAGFRRVYRSSGIVAVLFLRGHRAPAAPPRRSWRIWIINIRAPA
jgi:hypothetical protein